MSNLPTSSPAEEFDITFCFNWYKEGLWKGETSKPSFSNLAGSTYTGTIEDQKRYDKNKPGPYLGALFLANAKAGLDCKQANKLGQVGTLKP